MLQTLQIETIHPNPPASGILNNVGQKHNHLQELLEVWKNVTYEDFQHILSSQLPFCTTST